MILSITDITKVLRKKVTSDMKKPYIVTEYNGHMFPTKSFDDEHHREEQALRHAKVLNDVMKYDDIGGPFGWCFADYTTPKDFGAGDRICYHGVMDIFRIQSLLPRFIKVKAKSQRL